VIKRIRREGETREGRGRGGGNNGGAKKDERSNQSAESQGFRRGSLGRRMEKRTAGARGKCVHKVSSIGGPWSTGEEEGKNGGGHSNLERERRNDRYFGLLSDNENWEKKWVNALGSCDLLTELRRWGVVR